MGMFRSVSKSLVICKAMDSRMSLYFPLSRTLTSLSSASNPDVQKLRQRQQQQQKNQSLTVSYLTNSCGLSLEKAISASKSVNLESTERPDSVLELLRSHGFSQSHIAAIVSKCPSVILNNTDKILRPKIEFLRSLLGESDLPKILASCPQVLAQTSLEKRILPVVDFIKGFVKTDDDVNFVLRRYIFILRCSIEKTLMRNISSLRAHGVLEVNIRHIVLYRPRALAMSPHRFEQALNEVKEMGIEPESRRFRLAVSVMALVRKPLRERKKKLLMSYGWSKAEIHSAFFVQPSFIATSEEKITKLMDFYVNELGLKPSEIAGCPNILLISLERRVIPRCALLNVLISKGLTKKDVNFVSLLNWDKKRFDNKFVPLLEECPEARKAYLGEIDPNDSVTEHET